MTSWQNDGFEKETLVAIRKRKVLHTILSYSRQIGTIRCDWNSKSARFWAEKIHFWRYELRMGQFNNKLGLYPLKSVKLW